jgi:heparosan-N-sulfate-glucuronate 5-epimerase
MSLKAKTLFYLIKDFFIIFSGKSYFHEKPSVGKYFQDNRYYFYDFSMKADWTGDYKDNVPVLFIPHLEKQVQFPMMILQYGLGCVDRYFETQDKTLLKRIESVYLWITQALNSEYFFDNYFQVLMPEYPYFSTNSAMAQGHVLSFLVRIRKNELVPSHFFSQIDALLQAIFENMAKPIQHNGTSIIEGDSIFLCEVCRSDDYVVLNGWIYAIFGLIDLYQYTQHQEVGEFLQKTLNTLVKSQDIYFSTHSWTFYDNKKRIASPVYHKAHIILFEILSIKYPLLGFKSAYERCKSGYSILNIVGATCIKIVHKLKASHSHTTQT